MAGKFLASDHLGRLGVNVQRDELRDEVQKGEPGYGFRDRTTVSGYLQDEIVLPGGDVSLLAAGRLEASGDEGIHPTGKVGLIWRCLGKAHIKANLENTYRLPTFRELYYPDQGSIRGNPDLEPEESVNLDFGFGVSLQRLFFETAGFRNEVKESILWLPVSPFTIQPVNIGDVSIWGAEVDCEARPWDFLSLMANYIYLDAEVEETGKQMPGRPRHTVNVRGSLEGLLGDLYAELQYTSEIPITLTGTRRIGWRTVVNLGVRLNLLALPRLERWKGIESLSLALDVKNVGNVFFKDVLDFPLPGRAFFGTLQASF